MGVVIHNTSLLGEALAAEQLAELAHARHRVEVDLETRHATISFSLPSWVLDEPHRCGLGQWPASKPSPEAAQPRLPLLTWKAFWLGDRYVAVVTAVGAGGGEAAQAA